MFARMILAVLVYGSAAVTFAALSPRYVLAEDAKKQEAKRPEAGGRG